MNQYFFFNDTATTEIYTLSLHDALPIYPAGKLPAPHEGKDVHGGTPGAGPADRRTGRRPERAARGRAARLGRVRDRKSTRLNSSHANISYAVFCLKKKKHHLVP